MSRTYRKFDPDYGYFRKPKTHNEIRQLDIVDEEYEETPTSKHNHRRNRKSALPTDWDDLHVSARHEDWHTRHEA